jgi:hypothetical protein
MRYAFRFGFCDFYEESQNRRAGTYTYSNGSWRRTASGSQTSSSSQTSANTSKSYYATSNLRLRSEPDTSKDNRIASISEGERVEFIESGRTDTIEGITAPWFRVKTADGTIGWAFSGFLSQ